MNVVVYRTPTKLKKGQKRTVCEVPVFGKGASATENSLNATGRISSSRTTTATRIRSGRRAGQRQRPASRASTSKARGGIERKVWTNTTEAAPTVVPKLSTKTGLIYTYTQDSAAGVQRWSWSAIEFRNGRSGWKQCGTGASFNNNYAGIAIAPNGSLLLGTVTGIVGLRDGS